MPAMERNSTDRGEAIRRRGLYDHGFVIINGAMQDIWTGKLKTWLESGQASFIILIYMRILETGRL
jgi:hypothetical protein